MGVLSGHGHSLDALWEAVAAPLDGPVRPLEGFDPERWMAAKEVRRSAPYTQMAVAASSLAWTHAGLARHDVADPRRAGVVMSAAYGAPETLDEARDLLVSHGPAEVPPMLGAIACENAPASAVSARFGLGGPSKAVVGACAGGAMAIGDGVDLIRSGRCDLVVVGGTQAELTPTLVASYRNLRVLSRTGRALPFDARRDGFVFGVGAATMILESLPHARARGARQLGEVLGHASTNDAHDMARPTGDGATECMRLAMGSAGVDPAEIVAVNAHGTGTRMNDDVEAAAIAKVFGSNRPPVTSSKGVLGHTAAAAGVFEAAVVVLSLQHRMVPPVAVGAEPDPTLDIDVVWDRPRPVARGPMLSNSVGLGGVNCTLVIGPPPG